MKLKPGNYGKETTFEVRNFDAAISSEEYARLGKHPLYLVLDNLRSAFNVGAIFRTADAARIAGVLTCGYTAHPPIKSWIRRRWARWILFRRAISKRPLTPWTICETKASPCGRWRRPLTAYAIPKSTIRSRWLSYWETRRSASSARRWSAVIKCWKYLYCA